jgi:putative tryptophan/tyrosine transport system substrate-binding protein
VKRRSFITLLGGAAAWPLAARAQQPAMPVVGFLGTESPERFALRLRGFRQGLGETGFFEGQNVAIEYRWAHAQYDRLPALAADLISRQPNVIRTSANTRAALTAKALTSTIPIVFVLGVDPVEAGLVASLNRPGGNVTGITSLNLELGPKRLQILHELVPGARTMAILLNPTGPVATEIQSRDLQAAARSLGLTPHVVHASTEDEIRRSFAGFSKIGAQLLVIGADPFFTSRSEQVGMLALQHAVPAVYHSREFATAGGLMSYGGSFADMERLAGVYTGRILKGEKPADLPVQQATKVELILNLRTAKALGLTVPLSLLGRADEAIE